MRKLLLPLAILCLVSANVFAQQITKQEKGYFNIVELGYFTTNNEYEAQLSANSFKVTYDGAYALSLRNINGIFINNKISIGIGVGLENYTHKSDKYNWDNVFQLFFDTRYYFKYQENSLFTFADYGKSIPLYNNFSNGSMVNLGIGYKVKSSQKTALVGSVGFINQSIKEKLPVLRNRYYGFSFKVGLLL